eukprot:77948_1
MQLTKIHKNIQHQLASIHSRQIWTQNKHSSIAIIGAGASGVHMASLLSKSGYNNLTIFEKENRIGGKSWTIYDTLNYNTPQEMGAWATSSVGGLFDEVYKLFEEYDPDNKLIDLADNRKSIIECDGSIHDVDSFILQAIKTDLFPTYLHFLPSKITSILPMINAINKYCEIHENIFGKYEYSALPKPDKHKMPLINMSMLEFMNNNNLNAMIPLCVLLYTMFGYGTLDTIPAYYGLWWFKPNSLHDMIKVKSLINKIVNRKHITKITSKGFQSLWMNIAKKHNLNIKYNTNI